MDRVNLSASLRFLNVNQKPVQRNSNFTWNRWIGKWNSKHIKCMSKLFREIVLKWKILHCTRVLLSNLSSKQFCVWMYWDFYVKSFTVGTSEFLIFFFFVKTCPLSLKETFTTCKNIFFRKLRDCVMYKSAKLAHADLARKFM